MADCQKSCNKKAEQWKTTTDLLCLNQEKGLAEVGGGGEGDKQIHMW